MAASAHGAESRCVRCCCPHRKFSNSHASCTSTTKQVLCFLGAASSDGRLSGWYVVAGCNYKVGPTTTETIIQTPRRPLGEGCRGEPPLTSTVEASIRCKFCGFGVVLSSIAACSTEQSTLVVALKFPRDWPDQFSRAQRIVEVFRLRSRLSLSLSLIQGFGQRHTRAQAALQRLWMQVACLLKCARTHVLGSDARPLGGASGYLPRSGRKRWSSSCQFATFEVNSLLVWLVRVTTDTNDGTIPESIRKRPATGQSATCRP